MRWMYTVIALMWAVTALLWMVYLFYIPYLQEPNAALTGSAMLVIALAANSAAHHGKPLLMVVLAGISFIPNGLYLLGEPGLFAWTGSLNLACLIGSVILLVTGTRKQPARH